MSAPRRRRSYPPLRYVLVVVELVAVPVLIRPGEHSTRRQQPECRTSIGLGLEPCSWPFSVIGEGCEGERIGSVTGVTRRSNAYDGFGARKRDARENTIRRVNGTAASGRLFLRAVHGSGFVASEGCATGTGRTGISSRDVLEDRTARRPDPGSRSRGSWRHHVLDAG